LEFVEEDEDIDVDWLAIGQTFSLFLNPSSVQNHKSSGTIVEKAEHNGDGRRREIKLQRLGFIRP
jgi:hypothetical protein